LRLYKIGVSFDMTGDAAPAAQAGLGFSSADREKATRFAVTRRDKQMIRVLQQDLPCVEQPFDEWAEQVGVHVSELLTAARSYLRQRRMRRFSAVLHHRQAGFSANAMGAWAVPAEKQDEFGAAAARLPPVSHCYLRPTYPDWPYSIFTMVHGTSAQECEATLGAIAEATGVHERIALYSSREFKKTRLKYFAGDIEAWEESILSRRPN
jgi:DNA-binding Lrp family transcriptional regulator